MNAFETNGATHLYTTGILAVYERDYFLLDQLQRLQRITFFDPANQSHNCEADPWHFAQLSFQAVDLWICFVRMQPSKHEKHSGTFLTGFLRSEL